MSKPDHYAVFGNPIAHSKSPDIHRAFAEQVQHDIVYEKQCVDKDKFESAAREFFDQGGRGLNITVPFKEDAFEFADVLSDRARAAGAVNTLAIQEDGRVLGDNTDGVGLVNDIEQRLAWPIENAKILVLGAGGAVRGVLKPILEKSPAKLVVANRTLVKAEKLAELFTPYGEVKAKGFDALEGENFDIVINGTAASLSADVPPVPPSCIREDSCIYDMVYGAEPTSFMRWAQAQGAEKISDGLGMLVGQAAESFYIWRGVRVASDPVIAMLRQ